MSTEHDAPPVSEQNAEAEVVEYADGHMEYFDERAAEVTAQFAEEETAEEVDSEEAEEVQAESVEPAPEEEPEQPAEDKVDVLARLLEKEEKFRAKQDDFAKEREQFESKQAELEAELADYRKAKAGLKRNPIGFLKTLGASEDDLQTIAQMIYYDGLGEDAPAEYGQLKDKFELRQKLAELEEKLENQNAEKQQQASKAEMDRAHEQYVESLFDAVEEIPERFPLAQKYAEVQGEQAIVSAMYEYARQNAVRSNGQGNALTPEQCFQQLEKQLEALVKLNEPKAQEEPAPKPKKRRTLRSKTTKLQPPPEKSYDNMSPEEVKEKARENFWRKMEDGGFVR